MKFFKNSLFILSLLSFLVIFLTIVSCSNKENDLIPYAHVDFQIDILSTFYTELASVGGYVYVKGGYKGIILYRLSMDEFLAFDRSCSFEPRNPCERVFVEENRLTLKDSCCGSRFLILDGSPIEGPAKRLLHQYRTYFDGRFLRVFN